MTKKLSFIVELGSVGRLVGWLVGLGFGVCDKEYFINSNFSSFFYLQAQGLPDDQRRYTLRKRPTSVAERATFVCYTCGIEAPSSQLRLVYCCPNAEREPYYPFITQLTPYPNTSPISPQGMVQICSSCNEKNSHLAEGGGATSLDGRYTPSDNKSQTNSESSNVRFKVNVCIKKKNVFRVCVIASPVMYMNDINKLFNHLFHTCYYS